MKKREAEAVVKKFSLTPRKGKELFYKLVIDGRTILTTAIPKGKGDFHIERAFRQQLRLSEQQLRDAIKCPFGQAEYINHLIESGYLDS